MTPAGKAVFRALLRAARPWSLLAGLLLYALGAGIASYLGEGIRWPVYWLGQGAATMLQLSAFLLKAYFDRAAEPPFEPLIRRVPRPGAPPAEPSKPVDEPLEDSVEIIVPRVIFLQGAAAALTTGAVLTVLLYSAQALAPAVFFFIGLALLLGVAYAVPPLRLANRGYGELIMAFLVANLFPVLAYLLQVGDLHRLLAMLTFPLTFLYLAASLARSLQGYFEDLRQGRQTMLVRVGWQRGMLLHNVLIAMAYVTLSIAVIAGLPWQLAFPAFLSLPLGIFQIWQMNGIAGGAKPRWQLLGYTALATLGLMVYFMNLALWTW